MSATPRLRFAPSPNGLLHRGHAYSALCNADIAARLGGELLLRIEDIDPVRSRPELVAAIRDDLAWLGIAFAGEIRRQSAHLADYAAARDRLAADGLAYPCFCSRGAIRAAAGEGAARDPDGAPLYPGTCRTLPPAEVRARIAGGEPHTWRLRMGRALARRPGPHAYAAFAPDGDRGTRSTGRGTCRDVAADPARWGDAVIARRDVPTSYHLSVVLDDAIQGITHVVRGRDLEAATDLHTLLQRLLGLPGPRYHHHGLILDAQGEKLAKSRASTPLAALRAAGMRAEDLRAELGFPPPVRAGLGGAGLREP